MLLNFVHEKIHLGFEVTDDKRFMLLNFSGADREITVPDNEVRFHPAVELHLAGGDQDDHHGGKYTGTSAAATLRYVSHTYEKNDIGNKLEVVLEDSKVRVVMHYQFFDGISVMKSWPVVTNISEEKIGIEYLTSFALTGIDYGDKMPVDEKMRLWIAHNTWKREADWKEYALSELGLERIGPFSMKRININNIGTWSSKEHLPLAALDNKETGDMIIWQIEQNGSWQWEISDIVDKLYLKLSGPNEKETHWYKELAVGEEFVGVEAALCIGADFDSALEEMTKYRRKIVRYNIADDSMPVIFNDYMNCLWADPTEEKMIPIIDKAAELGAEYYVMDAGWYADGTWWETVGEWQPVAWRFPNGIKHVFDYIYSKGMVPGIWLEIESMGVNCPILDQFPDECFFMRHGKKVIDHQRYHLDFRHPKVREFATGVIDRLVGEYGARYIKMDYNIDGGIGTECNADSVGDGALGHNRAHFEWLKSIMDKYPELVFENCSSGGMRMDYKTLSINPIQSISDQDDYKPNSIIAAAAASICLPEQAAIWSYPMLGDTDDAIITNMVNAIPLRIHLSGQVKDLPKEQLDLMKEGVECYKKVREVKKECIPYYPFGPSMYGKDWMCAGYRAKDFSYMAVWRYDSDDESFVIPTEYKNVEVVYPARDTYKAEMTEEGVKVTLPCKYSAAVLKLR